jgi:poly-gamma-glutamate capsule biosynthesis protein CapA/YwtB (metallophosphatase superfamily)
MKENTGMDIQSNRKTADGFDWENGCWIKGKSQKADAEIIISGDWAPIRAFDEIIERTPEAIYGDVLPVLRSSDLRITNLECTLFGGNPVWKSGAVFKGRAEHIGGLTAVPFEVATLANNHVFDYGSEAFRQTKELLKNKSICFLGAGMSAREAHTPLLIDLKGIKVGIVNFSEGEDLTAAADGPGVFGWEVDTVAEIVTELQKTADIIIVICHCGVEYIAFPPPYVTDAFHRIADAGADLIIGHHAHVPQGLQIYNDVPICYSLGNFVFFQETDLLYRKVGYFVQAGITKESVTCLRIVPYEIGPGSLNLLQKGRYDWFMKTLQKVSLPLTEDKTIRDGWNGFLRYYGVNGFHKEIDMILKRMADEPQKGAAMFRNRVATMQHNQHWIDAMTRIMDGTINDSPAWAYELTEEWLTKKR